MMALLYINVLVAHFNHMFCSISNKLRWMVLRLLCLFSYEADAGLRDASSSEVLCNIRLPFQPRRRPTPATVATDRATNHRDAHQPVSC